MSTSHKLAIRPYLEASARVRSYTRPQLIASARVFNSRRLHRPITDVIPLKATTAEIRRVYLDILHRLAGLSSTRARTRRERLREAQRQQALAEAITALQSAGADMLIDSIVNDTPPPIVSGLSAYTDAPKTAEQLLASARRQALKLVKPNKTVYLRATGHTTDTIMQDGVVLDII